MGLVILGGVPDVTGSSSGLMSPEDKVKLDGIESGSTRTLLVFNEVPSGSINGSNAVFTLVNTPDPSTSLMLFKNGLLQRAGASNDFLLSGSSITFNSGAIPIAGDILEATYRYT